MDKRFKSYFESHRKNSPNKIKKKENTSMEIYLESIRGSQRGSQSGLESRKHKQFNIRSSISTPNKTKSQKLVNADQNDEKDKIAEYK